MRNLTALLWVLVGLTGANAQDASPTCTNAGNIYQVGQIACIAACHGRRHLAKCEAVGSTTTWTQVSAACPSATIMPPPRADLSEMPKIAAMGPMPRAAHLSVAALF